MTGALIFLIIVILIVGTLVAGVQKAKRDGTYLMPDPIEEGENITPESFDEGEEKNV